MRLYKRFTSEQPYPKPIVLEMGSKNPTIVTAKADLDKAVEGVVRAAFGYDGQKCSATSRLYIDRRIKDEFLARLIDRVEKLVVGDPRRRETFMGPVINRRAFENFKKYVADAVKAGGKILVGGKTLEEGFYAKGFYVQPTVIIGVPEDHYLWKQELFLPILLVSEFDTLEEAIAKANDTDYGLTAGIFTEDESEYELFFSKIELESHTSIGGVAQPRVLGRVRRRSLVGSPVGLPVGVLVGRITYLITSGSRRGRSLRSPRSDVATTQFSNP